MTHDYWFCQRHQHRLFFALNFLLLLINTSASQRVLLPELWKGEKDVLYQYNSLIKKHIYRFDTPFLGRPALCNQLPKNFLLMKLTGHILHISNVFKE